MEKCKSCYLRDSKPCYECSACARGDDHYRYCPTTHTNADRIRSMSDEELARFLWEQNGGNRYWKSVEKYLNWLQQPVKEEV
jgi:hypothetical protein